MIIPTFIYFLLIIAVKDDLEMQYNELQEKYKQTQSLASNLHTQLAKAQTEAEEWREELNKIRGELEEQIRILQNSLENSENERKICEDKWQREFEMLRTHNMGKIFFFCKPPFNILIQLQIAKNPL